MDKATRLAIVFVVAASAVLSWRAQSFWTGDYPNEAGPAIDALIHGRFHDFLEARPLMGPLSLLLRAPFAALSLLTGGGGYVDLYENAYRFGVFPCVLAAGVLGIVVAHAALRRGAPPFIAWGALALIVVNPASVKAITYGHPEEILCAALLVGALLSALYGHDRWAALLAVAALLTKQWAVLGLIPVALLMDPGRVRRYALVAAGVLLVVLAPVVIADAGTFIDVNRHLLDTRDSGVLPTNVWWLVTPDSPNPGVTHVGPSWLGLAAHPLIIVVCLAVAIALAPRVRMDPFRRALPLLALVMLLRSMLDPINNSYYHTPFFMALVAADALDRRYIPSLMAVAGLVALIDLTNHPALQATVYLLWSVAFVGHLAARSSGGTLGRWRRSSKESTSSSAAGSAVSVSSS